MNPPLDDPSSSAAPERRCLVAVCHNWPVVFTQTAQSLMELGWGDRVERAKAAHGFAEIAFAWFTRFPRVDALRDSAIAAALEDGFTHLLFLDADMKWPTDVLMRMLRHAHEAPDAIVSGLYVLKAPPYAPVALRDRFKEPGSVVEQFYHDHEYRATGEAVREEDVVGMGCTLVPLAICQALGSRPWFDYAEDDRGWPAVTEDVPFCLKAKAAGFRVLLDPSVRCVHVGVQCFDDRWAKRFRETLTETAAELQQRIKVVVRQSEAPPQEAA